MFRKEAVRAVVWVLALLLGAHGLAAQDAEGVAVRVDREPMAVPRTDAAIELDGQLDEAAWRDALAIPLNYETDPGENTPAPVATRCLLMFDERRLYVAFEAEDPDPAAIRAHLSDRDKAWDDDLVGVVLDPFNDERRAFQFFTNPLGVQSDSFLDDVNGNEDDSWNAIWDAAGRIGENGYVVEMAIPFHQLRFPRGGGEQVWGIDALRFYPRDQRRRLASQPRDRDLSCHLCQVSKLTGFEGISPGRNLEIAPTVTARRTDSREDFPSGPLLDGDEDGEAGLTVRWGVTPSLTVGAAINPDFSQVEADVAQLDVNEQFALFFPERRPFFLEGADFFQTPMNAVFTRNVADPDWGVKLTGKQGPNAVGFFMAEDSLTNLLFPGSQGSSGTSAPFASTDTAFRYRRDVGESSALGALVTSREGTDYSNFMGGFDGLLRLGESDTLRFQLLGSETEYPNDLAQEFDQPQGSFSDHAVRVAWGHQERGWNAFSFYHDVGPDFRADLGFMPRGGFRMLAAGANRVLWGDEDDWYSRMAFGGDVDVTEDESGQVIERELEGNFNFNGPRQSHVWFGPGVRERYFNGVTFDEAWVASWSEISPTGDLWFGLFWRYGDDIDFAGTREAEGLILEPKFRWNIGKKLRTVLEHNYRQLDIDEGRLFEANLSQLRLVYQLNLRTFVRAVFQYTRIERDTELAATEVDAMTERLFSQVLFSYKLNPQTVLFAGYSDNRVGDESVSLTQNDRTLFIKLGYAWVP